MYQYTVHKLDTKHLEQKPQHAEVKATKFTQVLDATFHSHKV